MENNCYLVTDERTNTSALIDVGEVNPKLFFAIKNVKIESIFLTHCHYDHSCGARSIKDVTGAKIYIHEADAKGLATPDINLSSVFQSKKTAIKADCLMKDGDEVTIGTLKMKVLHTPGHTAGGVCFMMNDILFTGDTLFKGSIGRTDFTTGDRKKMGTSLKRLAALQQDFTVFPGHGPQTTLSEERIQNPNLAGL